MIKEGDVKDPAQKKLRQDKHQWNAEAKLWIKDFIEFKKLINGAPNKYLKQRAKITDQVPANPGAILDSLSGRYQELAQGGAALVQEQDQYAQTFHNRPKKQPLVQPVVVPAIPTTPVPATDLTKQLAAALENKYQLVAEGSNPFTRLWSRIKTPRSGFSQKAQVRRLRLDMLNAALKSYRALGKLQVQVTRSSKQSVLDAYKEMKIAWDEWSIVSRNFNTYSNSLPGQPERTEQMREEGYSPEKEEAELAGPQKDRSGYEQSTDDTNRIAADYKNYGPFFNTDKEAAKIMRAMNAIKIKTLQDKGTAKIVTNAPAALELLYKKLISYLNQSLGTSGTSLQEIYQQSIGRPMPTPKSKLKLQPLTPSQFPLKGSEPPPPLEEEAAVSDQLEATAQAFLRKWLGKTRHQALPGKSSGLRIQVFDLAAKARRNIDGVMDMLEKGLDVDTIGPKMYEVTKQINALRSLMRSLHNVEKPKGKEAPSMLEGIF